MAENGKIINSIKSWLPVVIVTVGVITGWLTLQFKVNNICNAEIPALKEVDKELERAVDMAEAERNMTNQAVIKLQSDVAHIKETVDKNYDVQQQILKELRER